MTASDVCGYTGDFGSLCRAIDPPQPLKVILDFEKSAGRNILLTSRLKHLPVQHLVIQNMRGWVDGHSELILRLQGGAASRGALKSGSPRTIDAHIDSGQRMRRDATTNYGDPYPLWEESPPSTAFHLMPSSSGKHILTLDGLSEEKLPGVIYKTSIGMQEEGISVLGVRDISINDANLEASVDFPDMVYRLDGLIESEDAHLKWKSARPRSYGLRKSSHECKTDIRRRLRLDGMSVGYYLLSFEEEAPTLCPSFTNSSVGGTTLVSDRNSVGHLPSLDLGHRPVSGPRQSLRQRLRH